MFKVIITNAFISKGFENNPALKFSDSGDSVRFRIGISIYDANAENNKRWLNKSVKAFGSLCERIKKMQLKEGSCINLEGNMTLDVWKDSENVEQKAESIILTDIEYASIGNGGGEKVEKNANENKAEPAQTAQAQAQPQPQQQKTGGKASVADSPNYLGAMPFGGNSFFGE